LRDTRRDTGFDYERSAVLMLSPRQVLAIDFHPDAGGFQFLGGNEITEAP
jgi:hypothetical protein